MAIDTSKVSKIAKTVALGLNYSTPVLTAGATKVPECQMVGKRMGETYDFVVDDLTAKEFGTSAADGLSDGLTSRSVSLKVRKFGLKIASRQVESALDLGDGKDLAKKVGHAIADAASAASFNQALESGAEISISTKNVEKLVIAKAGELAGEYNEKVYGFINPAAKAQIVTNANAVQPIDSQKEPMKGLVGGYYDIGELYTVMLPKTGTGATCGSAQITSATVVGDTITIASGEAGKCYVFDGRIVVLASSTTNAKVVAISGGALSADATASDAFYPVWLRVEGAQAFGDCGSLMDCMKEKEDADGLTIAYNEKDNGSFSKDMEWGSAVVTGVADKKGHRIILCK